MTNQNALPSPDLNSLAQKVSAEALRHGVSPSGARRFGRRVALVSVAILALRSKNIHLTDLNDEQIGELCASIRQVEAEVA